MICIGIDPGLSATGVGAVTDQGPDLVLEFYDTIRPKGLTTQHRIKEVCWGVWGKVHQWSMAARFLAIEMPFLNPKNRNPKAFMNQCLLIGALMRELSPDWFPLYEVRPVVAKRAVTGWGGGGFGRGRKPAPTKRQVQLCVQDILKLEKPPPQDAADALAVAIWLQGEVKVQMRIVKEH